ncbi:MAG: hypothetical protein JOZ96_18915 [Acidobacteria bacterium]|nr:hypothetical protein [Acidobacteriota bacterium]
MADRQELLKAGDEGAQQHVLLTYAVLTGLTPLIPVPLVDDLVKNYFRKRLVRSLAASAGRALSAEELDALASEREGGCLRGCAVAVLVYPLKAVFRKIFYFLEWKRAVDLTSRTYHFGYLVGHAVRRREGAPALLDTHGARAVNEAIEAVCREAPIKPLESAVGGTFRKSKNVLRAAAALLSRSLRRQPPRPEGVAAAIESVEPEEERELQPVVTRLQSSLASVPEEHFRALRESLEARLGRSPTG